MSVEAKKGALRRLIDQEDVIGPDGVTRSIAAERELNLLVARVLRGEDGKRLVDYLRSITVFKAHGPGVATEFLQHFAGQGFIVGVIERRAQLGKQNKPQPKEQTDGGRNRNRTQHQPESE